MSHAANAVSTVIRTTMPPVPTMNALRWSRGASERHASAITTALSPLSTTLMTAILNSAVHISGSLNAGNQDMDSSFFGRSILATCHYAALSGGLLVTCANLTGTFQR